MLSIEDPASKRARVEVTPSESEILTFVSQRESFRQRQQFSDSDAIREQLRSLGVELFDKDREWRARDGRRGVLFTAGPLECPLADHEIQARVQEREEARRAKEWERSNVLRDELRRIGVELNDKESVWRTLQGRQGSYSASPRAPSLPGATIHHLIAERERLRAQQDFDAADQLRAKLAQHGVEIFDAERLWRTVDGQQGVIITGGHEVICMFTDSEISARVAKREEARMGKHWSEADNIRDDLRRQGVEVLDSQRIWCTTDGRQGPYPLVGQPSFQPVGPVAVPTVISQPTLQQAANTLVAAAGHRPGGGGNDVAAVAAQAIAGLALLAQQRQNLAPPPAVVQTKTIVTTSAPPFSDASILALINGREQARQNHDWTSADAIRADLRSHGVEVWDKERVWRANDGRSGMIAQSTPLSAIVGLLGR